MLYCTCYAFCVPLHDVQKHRCPALAARSTSKHGAPGQPSSAHLCAIPPPQALEPQPLASGARHQPWAARLPRCTTAQMSHVSTRGVQGQISAHQPQSHPGRPPNGHLGPSTASLDSPVSASSRVAPALFSDTMPAGGMSTRTQALLTHNTVIDMRPTKYGPSGRLPVVGRDNTPPRPTSSVLVLRSTPLAVHRTMLYTGH